MFVAPAGQRGADESLKMFCYCVSDAMERELGSSFSSANLPICFLVAWHQPVSNRVPTHLGQFCGHRARAGMTIDIEVTHSEVASALRAYAPSSGRFDEWIAPDGRPKPHWEPFIECLSLLSSDDQKLRADALNRLVRETGIAHDIFADPDLQNQPWQVDLIPLIIESTQWQWLEAALVQRARLMNAILADVYGPQNTLISGEIPPCLMYADNGFLRPCHSIAHTDGHVRFYAVDLIRDRDGQWRAIDSHAETPGGVGFALANRVVYTHVAAEMFRSCNAVRLATFFDDLRGDIARRANRDDPRVALLTPGPHHDDYFSHTYLARYLGYELVEGADLRVIRNRVYLKTLEGLKEVDVLVRCIDGAIADPLELDPSGFLGSAGLVQATRLRPGLVTNALGSGLAENRALGSLLPKLCRSLLGEDLMLHDAPRYWLGEASARQRVLHDLDGYVIRPARDGTGRPGRASAAQNAAELSANDRAKLKADVELKGSTLVAEPIGSGAATTPSWTSQGLRPEPYAVRLFVAAVGRDDYVVMPGGLSMTLNRPDSVSMISPEGRSRDVWVLSDQPPVPHVSLWPTCIEHVRVQRTSRGLQSRVADNLFWLGRYCERTDWVMRTLRSALSRVSEDSGGPEHIGSVRAALNLIVSKDTHLRCSDVPDHDSTQVEQIVGDLIVPAQHAYGLRTLLDHMLRVASLTRDRLPLEAWRSLNHLHERCSWPTGQPAPGNATALELLEEGIQALAAFSGLMMENMTRNFGWRFLDLGRRLERSVNTAELLQAFFSNRLDDEELNGRLLLTLELADSFITYRSRYRMSPVLSLVLDLLLADESNPRSTAFQLIAIREHLEALPRAATDRGRSEEQRQALALLTQVQLADVGTIASVGKNGRRNTLISVLEQQVSGLPELSEMITRRYFNLTDSTPRRVLTRLAPSHDVPRKP